jgi:hypothetical protein
MISRLSLVRIRIDRDKQVNSSRNPPTDLASHPPHTTDGSEVLVGAIAIGSLEGSVMVVGGE